MEHVKEDSEDQFHGEMNYPCFYYGTNPMGKKSLRWWFDIFKNNITKMKNLKAVQNVCIVSEHSKMDLWYRGPITKKLLKFQTFINSLKIV